MKELKRIRKIKILMYHRVLPEKPAKNTRWHYVTVTEFRRQLELIDKLGFTPITFADYQLSIEGKLTLPAKPIMITFDDGYVDTLEHAVPVLLEYHMRAVVFVMGNRSLKSAIWDQTGDSDYCPLMTDEQIRTVQQLGFEIGAHSLNHFELTRLTDFDTLVEVSNSKLAIERMLNTRIQTFSYPYGSVDERVKKVVADSGFRFACGVYSGSSYFSQTSMDFRRIAVNQHTSRLKFLMTLLLPYQHLEWLYNQVKSGVNPTLQTYPVSESKSYAQNGASSRKQYDIQKLFNPNTL